MTEYFLFANPSFVSGMARVLDIGSTMLEFNSTFYPEVADYYAIKSDWIVVGDDIKTALNKYGEKEATP
jgi:hypothetical protein